jgi:NAD(P)-dependent dehydrogenase (short-subunit alcohol dehydrogenase family)
MHRLSGKVAIVTGAASRGEGVGNGAATAILFAREGAKVVLVNRSAARAKALEEQIRAEGGEAAACATDVTQPQSVEAMAQFAVARYGRLDILHNNVGFGTPGTPETVGLDEWNHVLEASLTSAMLCCRSCIPRMRASGGGSIINVSSAAGAVGLSGSPGAVAYARPRPACMGSPSRSPQTMRLRVSA